MSVIDKAQYFIDEFVDPEYKVISVASFKDRPLEVEIRTTGGKTFKPNGLPAVRIMESQPCYE